MLLPVAALLAPALNGAPSPAAKPPGSIRYEMLAVAAADLPPPANKRAPFGWPVFALHDVPVRLRPTVATNDGNELSLRITVAVDDRELRQIEVLTGEGNQFIGAMDLRFSHSIETFHLAIPEAHREQVWAQGVVLRQKPGARPIWFFAAGATLPVELQPHLMSAPADVDRLAAFHRRFASPASVQIFGWMEGCVLEGLRALAERQPAGPYAAAREAHWRLFVPAPGKLIYENHRGEPFDGRLYGIEGGLPFVDLAKRDPSNPLIDLLPAFTAAHTRPDGAIQDAAEPSALTAEGSYTIAYPLAVIAAARGQPRLAEIAHHQLLLARDRLWHDGALWLRHFDTNDSRTFRGWSRGVAWYALGLARSIEALRPQRDTSALEAELRRVARWVMPFQRADGLWPCYVENASLPPDTSGSAGIAAALACGTRLGVLPAAAGEAAQRTLAGELSYLTPDGMLGGVAQSNRGGDELQRSDYRVHAFFGMGLLAQLIAECDALAPHPASPVRQHAEPNR